MNYDFTGKSIKCETWEQMLHLAKLAEEQKSKPNERWEFSEIEFNKGNVWFVLDHDYMTYVCQSVPTCIYNIEISYTDFITPTETIEVTGCDGCPMYIRGDIADTCLHPKYEWVNKYEYPFTYCPLKKSSITIKLKNNDTTGN